MQPKDAELLVIALDETQEKLRSDHIIEFAHTWMSGVLCYQVCTLQWFDGFLE